MLDAHRLAGALTSMSGIGVRTAAPASCWRLSMYQVRSPPDHEFGASVIPDPATTTGQPGVTQKVTGQERL